MKWIPKIISLMFLWGAVLTIILFIEPELLRDILIPGSYLPFFVLLSITIWYTLAILFRTMIGSFTMMMTIVGGIILTKMRLMHFGLALVLLLTLVMESWYIYNRHEKINKSHEQKDRGASL